jgi:hypothetical protein
MPEHQETEFYSDRENYLGEYRDNPRTAWIVAGIAIGAAIGLGVAAYSMSRDKRFNFEDLEDMAEDFTGDVSKKMSRFSKDASKAGRYMRKEASDAGHDVMKRLRHIFEEGQKVVDEANEYWADSKKKLVG